MLSIIHFFLRKNYTEIADKTKPNKFILSPDDTTRIISKFKNSAEHDFSINEQTTVHVNLVSVQSYDHGYAHRIALFIAVGGQLADMAISRHVNVGTIGRRFRAI